MKGKLAVCIAGCLAMSLVSCAGGGKSKRCTEKSPSSFRTFLDDEWTTYCAAYVQHTEQPSEFTLRELTAFLGAHPGKAKELRQSLARHQDYDTCFDTSKEQLRLRSLESCLTYDEKQQLELINAWKAAVKPWIEETGFEVQGLEARLIEVEQDLQRLRSKGTFHFDRKTPVPPEMIEDHERVLAELDALDAKVNELEGAGGRFEDLVENASGAPALVEAMKEDEAPEINAIAAELSDMRQRIDGARGKARFLDYAYRAIGVPCPDGQPRARKESKVAEGLLGSKVKEVNGSGVRIATTTKTDKAGDREVERFTGFVCGVRSPENQFAEMPRQCGQYLFVVERQQGEDEEWGEWAVKTFEESGPSGSIDCELLAGKPKPKPKPKNGNKGGVVF